MPEIKTNPLLRLHAVFKKGLGLPGGTSTKDALRVIVPMQEASEGAEIRALSKLIDLFSQADRFISLVETDSEDYRNALVPFGPMLSTMAMDNPWNNAPRYNPSNVSALRLAGEALIALVPEHVLVEEELKNLRNPLQELRNEIGESGLSRELKASLLREITKVIDMVYDYPIYGAEGIREAAAGAYGKIIIRSDIYLPEKENPLIKKYLDCLGLVVNTISAAMYAHQATIAAMPVVEKLLP